MHTSPWWPGVGVPDEDRCQHCGGSGETTSELFGGTPDEEQCTACGGIGRTGGNSGRAHQALAKAGDLVLPVGPHLAPNS
jgi:DnaJ-class molecular chaperone